MQISLVELQELTEMRENIRRTVAALELCWSCQRISECEPAVVDDGPPVWLCAECARQDSSQRRRGPGALTWPFGS